MEAEATRLRRGGSGTEMPIGEEAVLHVFDPLGKKHWKTWDWQDGRLMLYAIAEYQGEWYGPLEVPK